MDASYLSIQLPDNQCHEELNKTQIARYMFRMSAEDDVTWGHSSATLLRITEDYGMVGSSKIQPNWDTQGLFELPVVHPEHNVHSLLVPRTPHETSQYFDQANIGISASGFYRLAKMSNINKVSNSLQVLTLSSSSALERFLLSPSCNSSTFSFSSSMCP